MSIPKVSVVIPVYNAQNYLLTCVNSVRGQTLTDIEIICVDDCSQDESRRMLSEMAAEDDRIRLCFHEENKSVFVARKTGAAASTGEYVLFLDSDDYLDLTACEELYNKAEKEKVDILHFCCDIFNDGAVNEEQNKEIRKLLRPYYGKLTGADVFESGFARQKVWGTLWNKLYRGELCRKAFSQLPEANYAVGEDLLTFCVIAHYAQSYLGWKSKPLYHYRVGNGISTGGAIGLEQFRRQCVLVEVNRTMAAFCEDWGVYDKAKDLILQLKATWLNHCCESWYARLPKECAAEGWTMLCGYWGAENVTAHIAESHFHQRKEISGKLEHLPRLPLGEKPIKTVGMYYHRMYNGGVERVISILAPMFLKMGYGVVIITDEPPQQRDFPLPEEVAREVIQSNVQTNAYNIGARFATWSQVVKKHSVDVVLYNAWMSDLLLWDTLHLKSMGIPVVVHTHGVFSCTIAEMKELFSELPGELRLADGIVTLSELDKVFWDNYQENVHCIPNPVSTALSQAKPARWDSRSLIWIGRASPEKQPEKALDIMERVVARIPEAKLLILGSFSDPKWKKLVKSKGLERNVEFCGLVSNVNTYLRQASVYLSTSQFEGFPMALVEAQAHALPTVMFRMSNLTLAAPGRGVVSVDMDDVTSAAEEIVKLLRDEERWERESRKAYESYQWLQSYDLPGAWQDVLAGNVPPSSRNDQVAQMLDMLIAHYDLGIRTRDNVSSTVWLLGKIIGGIRCCEENGLPYTLGLAVQKIVRRFKR